MIFLFVFRPPPLPHDTPWSPSYGNRAVPLQKVCVCVRACIFDSSPIIPPSTRGHPGGGDSRPFRRLSPQETLPLPNLEPEKEKRKQKHLFDLHVCSEERREGSPSLSARLVGSLREWPIRRGAAPKLRQKRFALLWKVSGAGAGSGPTWIPGTAQTSNGHQTRGLRVETLWCIYVCSR